jgi:hypothetical protein
MINGGLAFTEQSDLRKLENYAQKGWIFEKIVFGGLLYQLVQGPSSELSYSIDYQLNPDAEYFTFFKEANWTYVSSYGKQIHIFSAPKGNTPIYSDEVSEIDKYEIITKQLGKASLYTGLSTLLFLICLVISNTYYQMVSMPFLILFSLCLIAFIFCVMPFSMFTFKNHRSRNE